MDKERKHDPSEGLPAYHRPYCSCKDFALTVNETVDTSAQIIDQQLVTAHVLMDVQQQDVSNPVLEIVDRRAR
jgi:hypothetical protein